MSKTNDQTLLDALLDSWARNNTILLNLLKVLPAAGLEARVAADSPTVAEMFTHIHYVRMVFISEDAPEFAVEVPQQEWTNEHEPGHIAQMLRESAKAVQEAVNSRLNSGREMDLHYDHPILFLQHMIWHEGYHHGQIKLTLKLAGHPISDEQAGPLTWGIWMRKTQP